MNFVICDHKLVRFVTNCSSRHEESAKKWILDYEISVLKRILDEELEKVKKSLSQNEAILLLDIMKGNYEVMSCQSVPSYEPNGILWNAEDCQEHGYPEKWNVDYDSLMDKLNKFNNTQLWSLEFWIRTFWVRCKKERIDAYEETSEFKGK